MFHTNLPRWIRILFWILRVLIMSKPPEDGELDGNLEE